MQQLTVPGKVFIIGEYSVLQGGVGLFAALKPGYRFEISENVSRDWIHPESPVGVYQNDTGNLVHFTKTAEGSLPGFGSSTAELIAGIFADVERLPETKRVWAWYKEFFPKASGADLVAQLEALRTGASLFEVDRGVAESLASSTLLSQIEVFQIRPEIKLHTHEALKRELPSFDVKRLNALVKEVKRAFVENDIAGLRAFYEYAEIMHEAGVETELANQTRNAFMQVKGVLAAKGCGAGLHDVFLVVKDLEASYIEASGFKASDALARDLKQVAENFGLKFLGNLRELLW